MYKLLATSALVAAGLWGAMDSASAQQAKPGFPWATSPISVVVGGYHSQVFGFSSNKDNINSAGNIGSGANNKASSTSQQSDSEIWFGGRTTLANGIAIGFDVQLEGNTAGDVIDESYLFIDGAFGRVVMGSSWTSKPMAMPLASVVRPPNQISESDCCDVELALLLAPEPMLPAELMLSLLDEKPNTCEW